MKIQVRHVKTNNGAIAEQRMLFGVIPVTRRYLENDVRKAEADMLAAKTFLQLASQNYTNALDVIEMTKEGLDEDGLGHNTAGTIVTKDVKLLEGLKIFGREGLYPKQPKGWKAYYNLVKGSGAIKKTGPVVAKLLPTVATVISSQDHMTQNNRNNGGNNNNQRNGKQNNNQRH